MWESAENWGNTINNKLLLDSEEDRNHVFISVFLVIKKKKNKTSPCKYLLKAAMQQNAHHILWKVWSATAKTIFFGISIPNLASIGFNSANVVHFTRTKCIGSRKVHFPCLKTPTKPLLSARHQAAVSIYRWRHAVWDTSTVSSIIHEEYCSFRPNNSRDSSSYWQSKEAHHNSCIDARC